MSQHLHIKICEHFRPEAIKVLAPSEFPDIRVSFFPGRCGRPPLTNGEITSTFESNNNFEDSLVFGCACLSRIDDIKNSNVYFRYLRLEQCFQMFTTTNILQPYLDKGAYLLTPGWLENWRHWISQFGESDDQARQIFSECVSRLVLLDTDIDPKSTKNLEELSEYLDRPSETIRIGLDFFRLFLTNEILKWRLEKNILHHTSTIEQNQMLLGNYAMAIDLIGELPRSEREEVVVKKITDLFIMLFAAGKFHYLSFIDDHAGKLLSFPAIPNEVPVKERLAKFNRPSELTESGKGFRLRIGPENRIMAVIEIDDLAMTEYITNYQNLALAMSGVFALAIENSRFFEQILKNAETLRLSELRFRILFEQAPIGTALFDSIAGHFLQVNQKFCEISRYTMEDMLKINFTTIVRSQDLQEILDKINLIITGKINSFKIEKSFIRKDGSIIWANFTFVQMWDEHEIPRFYIVLVEDISERKKAEAEHMRLQNLESLGILAGGIAHDFNNLLTTIMGNASLAQTYEPDKDVQDKILRILESSKKAAGLAKKLLTFASGGTPNKNLISIRKIIQDLVNRLINGSNIVAEINFKETLLVEADAAQLSQAIENIILNAKEAMPLGGKIQIFTEDVLKDEKPFIKISVEDTGIGISHENFNNIFNPYFSTKPRGSEKGSGLGLSVTHSIIKRHGGDIFVSSQVGIGSIFEILLPA